MAIKLHPRSGHPLPLFPLPLQILKEEIYPEVCLDRTATERRAARRYELHLPIHFRVSQKGSVARWGSGTTREMSTTGLSFRSRKPLQVGSHVEMIVDWPAKYADDQPIDLQLTGFVVRSDTSRTAVRVTSRRFRINSQFDAYRA